MAKRPRGRKAKPRRLRPLQSCRFATSPPTHSHCIQIRLIKSTKIDKEEHEGKELTVIIPGTPGAHIACIKRNKKRFQKNHGQLAKDL